MRKLFSIFFLLAGQVLAQQETPSQTSILLTATDAKGNPIALSPSDLRIEVGGAPAVVKSVQSAADLPVTFAILLDLSGSMRDKMSFLKKATLELFDSVASEKNRGIFLLADEKVSMSKDFITRDQLEQVLSKLSVKGHTSYTFAISSAAEKLANVAPSSNRRIVFVITDGDLERARSKQLERSAIEACNRTHSAIFAVATLGGPDPEVGRKSIQRVTHQTGGAAVFLEQPDKFADKLQRYLAGLSSVTFEVPPGTRLGLQPLAIRLEPARKVNLNFPSLVPIE